MNVESLIKELQLWDKDLLVVVDCGLTAEDVIRVRKEKVIRGKRDSEYYYLSNEPGTMLSEDEVKEAKTSLAIRPAIILESG